MKFKPFATVEAIFQHAEDHPGAARVGRNTAAAAMAIAFAGYFLGHEAGGITTAAIMLVLAFGAYLYGAKTLYKAYDPRTREMTVNLPAPEAPRTGPSDADTAEMPVITSNQVLNYTRDQALQALELSQDGRMNLTDARASLIAAVNAIDNHMVGAE